MAVLVQGNEGSSIVTANVGDSRVVLCRKGAAVELTKDHKPNSESEITRIKKLGGFVQWHGFLNADGEPIEGTGVYRVNNNLAVARAIGDASEKPYISAIPEIREIVVDREQDQFVIIATDGLWDVMTSEEAVEYVHSVMSGSLGALREGRDHLKPAYRPAERRLSEWVVAHPTSDRSMIRAAIHSRKNKMGRYLCEEAMRRGTGDNISVVVVWLQ